MAGDPRPTPGSRPDGAALVRGELAAVRRYAAGHAVIDVLGGIATARFHVVPVPSTDARPLGKRPYFGPPRARVRWQRAQD